MNKEDKIIRLKQIIKHLGLNQTEFGEAIKVSQSNISAILNGKRSFEDGIANKIALSFDTINTGWLLTGEGEMLKNMPSLVNKQKERGVEEEVYQIPLLPIAAIGGTLNDFVVSVKGMDCEMVVAPIKGADFAISVSGDSMSPEYPNGSQILIKRINERAFIDWGKTYVLDTCNGVVIKKLMPVEGSKECVQCVSINPDYPSFEVSFADIFGVYRVLMSMSMK